jgi:hypothetical protein
MPSLMERRSPDRWDVGTAYVYYIVWLDGTVMMTLSGDGCRSLPVMLSSLGCRVFASHAELLQPAGCSYVKERNGTNMHSTVRPARHPQLCDASCRVI